MKTSAAGRILFWRGGSLWIGRAGEPTTLHAHHAVQIALPFPGGQVRFQGTSGGWKSYAAALVATHLPHAFEARGQLVAQIFVEPESREGRRLQKRQAEPSIVALRADALHLQAAALAAAYNRRAADSILIDLARNTRALELIRARLGDAIPLRAMATATHLSADRFRHLFMQETGVGFRAYLLWLRLESALAAFVGGATLTEAAYIGGFADSAHFSRTFRRMFGIAPASVRLE
jgi:AraC family transcriptional regulator